MTSADSTWLNTDINMMSNERLGASVVYQGDVFYDVGVRLKGSQHGRALPVYRGYSVKFHADELFRGVHETIGIDRSGGWRFGTNYGQDEILIYHFFNHASDVPSMYDDLVYMEAPGVTTGSAILKLARYNDVYLGSQYENGEEGTEFEYDLVYYPLTTTGGPEDLKVPNPDAGTTVPISDMGDSKENYRYHFIIKNNRAKDDYSDFIEVAKAFSLTGDDFHQQTQQLLDVDQWLRTFAAVSLAGVSDSYFTNTNQHNAMFYTRPEDGKTLLFGWDMDFAFITSATSPLSMNTDLDKLLTLPSNERLFYGHLNDIVNTSYNTTYMADWVTHYDDLLPGQDLSSILTYIGQRAAYVSSQFPPHVDFHVSTNGSTQIVTTLVPEDSAVRALVPSVANGGDQLGISWTGSAVVPDTFDDSAWTEGTAGVGYETTPADYDSLINLDVETEMYDTNSSVFVRIPFDVVDAGAFDTLTLKMKYDDGFVAYLNGVKVAEPNAPASPEWNSGATESHDDTAAAVFQDFSLTGYLSSLHDGPNVLAIHGLNWSTTSSDLLIAAELEASQIQGGTGDTGIEIDSSSIDIAGDGWINVREVFVEGRPEPLDVNWTSTTAWQAAVPLRPGLNALQFRAFDFQGNPIDTPFPNAINVTSTVSGSLIESLRISEIMYHPVEPTTAEVDLGFTDQDQFEFIELVNTSSDLTLDMTGIEFTDGVIFDFTDSAVSSLDAGERILVVRDEGAMNYRYPGISSKIAGEYIGGLKNGGETIKLVDANGSTVAEFTYKDGPKWPQEADGGGSSLVPINVDADLDECESWHASVEVGGSPGEEAAALVLSRHVFYGGSSFDTAIATDKRALLPGGTATLANITNYSGGIDGIIVDLGHAPNATLLEIGDLALTVGNDDDPAAWTHAADATLEVLPGGGRGGSDRLVITWTADAPKNTWLKVTVPADGNTGLPAADVFYFGNAPGEVTSALGASFPTPPLVNAADVIAIRDNPRGPQNPADINNPHDINRDRAVDATDMILARNHATSPLSALRLIALAEAAAPAPMGEGESTFATGSSGGNDTPSIDSLDGLMAAEADRPAVEAMLPSATLSKLLRRLGSSAN